MEGFLSGFDVLTPDLCRRGFCEILDRILLVSGIEMKEIEDCKS